MKKVFIKHSRKDGEQRLLARKLFLFAFLIFASVVTAFGQIKVRGKYLYDPNGERLLLRGFENSFGIALSENGNYIDEMAKTGANAVRILPNVRPNQMTLAQVENLIAKAKGHGMVVIITPRTPVPEGSTLTEEQLKWFEQDDVYAMLQRYKDILIIDGIVEMSYRDEVRWVNDCKMAINRLRTRGYVVPLLMMADGYGRLYKTVVNNAAEVFNHDPLKNTYFNVQAYWDQTWDTPKKYSTQIIQENLAELNALQYCVQIGVCPWAEGAPCDNGYVDYKTAMAECQKYGMGWLVWEWYNPYEWSHVFKVSADGTFNNLNNHCENPAVAECRDNGVFGCDYGYQVALGHAASIQKTAVKTCYMRGNVNCSDLLPPSVPGNLASPSKTSNSVNLTWTASTDNRGVAGYNVYIGNSTTAAATSTTTSVTVTNLSASTDYSFTVKARDAAGNPSDASTPLLVTTNPSTASGTLLAHEHFNAAAGTLHGNSTGTGWGAAWLIQNADVSVPGYNVAGSSSLTYSTLSVSGRHAVGGDSYQTSGRALNVSSTGPFSSYLTNGNIGLAGKTLWISTVLRKDGANDDRVALTFHPSTVVHYTSDVNAVSIGYFGTSSNSGGVRYWSLKIGSTIYRSSVAIVSGQSALLVGRLVFGATNTVTLYVNPNSLGGNAPSTASASATSTGSIAFKSMAFYGGNTPGQGAVDEIRFGTTYSSVTPTGSTNSTLAAMSPQTEGNIQAIDSSLIADSESVVLYPNPAVDVLRVSLPVTKQEKATIDIRNLAGQSLITQNRVLQPGLNEIEVNVSSLQPGMYLIIIQSAERKIVKKLSVGR